MRLVCSGFVSSVSSILLFSFLGLKFHFVSALRDFVSVPLKLLTFGTFGDNIRRRRYAEKGIFVAIKIYLTLTTISSSKS